MPAWQDVKDSTARPQGSVPICLRGDLAARYTDLDRQLVEAQAGSDANSMAAGADALLIAEEMAVLRQHMLEHTYRFTFQALPRSAWRRLVEDHPPRDGRAEDTLNGVNMGSFPTVLLAASCVDIRHISDDASAVVDAEPILTVADAEEMTDRLTDGQVMLMFGCAASLNRGTVDLPKSVTASEIMERHVPRSKLPEPGV